MATVFFSYSHADEVLRDRLEKQLALLKRQGLIETWHDRRIGAGAEFAKEIDEHVHSDDIILLLVSPDFLDSDYCYEKEMLRALERHQSGDAVVIPVILRPCDWQHAPFGKLNATPPDGRPITKFPDLDEAMLEVSKAVRSAAEKVNNSKHKVAMKPKPQIPPKTVAGAAPRSSNLALARKFTRQDLDNFQLEAFEYMANFFENSLTELAGRNPGIDTTFRRIDANRFSAIVYRDGEPVTRATVFLGVDSFANGIAFSHGDVGGTGSFNELLTAAADDEALYFSSLGMSHRVSYDSRDKKLTMEGAAEHYWAMFIHPLQPRA